MVAFTGIPPRVVILGAGAVGTHLASALADRSRITVVDTDPAIVDAFRARGIEALDPERDLASFDFAEEDLAVVATPADCVASAVGRLPAWVPVVCLSNGLDPDAAPGSTRPLARGVVEFGVRTIAPGRACRTRAGWLTLQRRAVRDATARLLRAIDPQRIRARLSDDIDAHRRAKLLINSSLDPVTAVMGCTMGEVFASRDGRRAFLALLREGVAVARASGWRLAHVGGTRPTTLAAVFGAPVIGSLAAAVATWQARGVITALAGDVRRGRPGEIDHLCGAIVRAGERAGVPTPTHRRAIEVVTATASGAERPRPALAAALLDR